MLAIRQEQLDVFAQARLRDFERRLLPHILERLNAAGVDLDERVVAAQVRRAITSARRFFHTERDVARYCEIVVVQLKGETDHPTKALDMLSSPSLDGRVRLNNFERWVKLQKGAHAGR